MEKYRIEIKKSAAKEIENLPAVYLKPILERITLLSRNPRPQGCEKLTADEKYRIRQGPYRIVYLIEDKLLTIYVVKVGHRRDVYR